MSRSMLELEQELVAMWQLVNELSEQLASNRALTETLQAQAKDVKGQAVHSGTGFPLRRFNIDISDEQFTSELEKFASHLVLENQNLQFENKQLNLLLKEYEQTLEGVMSKFRAVSHAAQQHELTLHSYYTSLLHQLRTSQSASTLLDSTTLSVLLTRLSTLLRAALRSVNGESPPSPSLLPQGNITALPDDLTALLTAGGTASPDGSSPSSVSHPTSRRHAQWMGDLGTAGGYAGTEGRADWALEREAEIARLIEENKLLREMLGIDRDVVVDLAGGKHAEQVQDEARVEKAGGEEKKDGGAETRVKETDGKDHVKGDAESLKEDEDVTTTDVVKPTDNLAEINATAAAPATDAGPPVDPPSRTNASSTSLLPPKLISSLSSPSAPTTTPPSSSPTATAKPAEMIRSISSPPSAANSTNGVSTTGTSTSTCTPSPTSTPTYRSPSRALSPHRPTSTSTSSRPPPALSPPIIRTPIPLPTLGHASGSSSPPSSAPSTPLSSLFIKSSSSPAQGGQGGRKTTKTGPTTAVSGLGMDLEMGLEREKDKDKEREVSQGGIGVKSGGKPAIDDSTPDKAKDGENKPASSSSEKEEPREGTSEERTAAAESKDVAGSKNDEERREETVDKEAPHEQRDQLHSPSTSPTDGQSTDASSVSSHPITDTTANNESTLAKKDIETVTSSPPKEGDDDTPQSTDSTDKTDDVSAHSATETP